MTQESWWERLSWKDLTVIGPTMASVFAFTYVVGYFYAFDIAWFPFFSFTEHLVFALRALPIAIGASAAFLIALSLSTDEDRWKWFYGKGRWLRKPLSIVWILVISGMALGLLITGHFGPFVSLATILAVTITFHIVNTPLPLFTIELRLGIDVTLACFVIGLASGYLEKIHVLPTFRSSMIIVSKNPSNPSQLSQDKGHVIFVGDVGVLFYDYAKHSVRLIRRDDVTTICGCKSSDWTTDNASECLPGPPT